MRVFVVKDAYGHPVRRFHSRREAMEFKTVNGRHDWTIKEVML